MPPSSSSLLSYRVAGMRVFDFLLTVVVLWAFFGIMQSKRGKVRPGAAALNGLLLSLGTTLPLSVFFHALFGVPTAMTCRLGLADPVKCAALKKSLV